MRNKVLVAALLIILPFFITACTLQDLPVIGRFFGGAGDSNEIPTDQAATISIWGLWESPEVMDKLIIKYRETHPNITVNYDDRSVLKLEDYKETVYTRAGQESAPDIVFVHNSWVPGLKGSLAPAPANVMSAQDYASRFYPAAQQSAVLDDSVYAAPVYYDGLVLVYNKKHFEEIDQTVPPTAWEEFRRLALELTIRGQQNTIVRAGAAMGAADNITFFSDILGLMFSQAQVNIPADLDSKAAQDALAFYANFMVEDKVWDNTMPEASSAFAQEKVSMIFVPAWSLLDIVTARPDLDIGVAPVPQALPDTPAAWSSFWMMAVPSGSANKAVAWDFIKFMSQDEQQLSLFSENSAFRKFGSPYSSTALKSQLDSNPYLKPVLDTAPYASTGRIAARAGNKSAVEALRTAVNEMSIPTADPAAVLKTAKDAIVNTR
ncbi:hypothetical protein A2619_03565 [candidate division WWE3 bacterium RIFOXYD1_FULL_39_9]|nr:MAG: hypothetical protein A2619_03565 [candidate division WWE3 bacterium RIFOXYD1_FULL_39_9]